MKDELKPLFDNYRPELGDSDEYMLRLQQKMALLETVKRYADEQRRLYRRRMVIAFAVGVMLGAATITYILLNPVIPQPDLSLTARILYDIRPIITVLTITVISISVSVLCTLQPSKSCRVNSPVSGE